MIVLKCKCGVELTVDLQPGQEVASFECASCSGVGKPIGVMAGALHTSCLSLEWGFYVGSESVQPEEPC